MKNLLILTLLVLNSFNSFSQSHLIKGTIVDEQKRPIPFVNVYLIDKSNGVVATGSGTFELSCAIKKNDSIVFSCLGYKTSFVSLSECLINSDRNFVLQTVSNELKEVSITDYKFKTKEFNYFKKPEEGFVAVEPEFEQAILIPNRKGYKGYIKNVSVYVKNIGKPQAPFRVHIYECSSISDKPGKELTQNSIVANAMPGDEWVMINLESLRIKIPENGFFVGVEALPFEGYVAITPQQWDSIIDRIKCGDQNPFKIRNVLYLGEGSHFYQKGLRLYSKSGLGNWTSSMSSPAKHFVLYSSIAVKASIAYYSKSKDEITSDSDFNLDFTKNSKRQMKKILTQIQKYDDKKFPHGNIKEFFESNLKAVKENSIPYLFTYLYVNTKEEKEDFLDDLQRRSKNEQLFSNEEIKNAIDFFNYCLNNIDRSNLVQVKSGIYKLELPDKRNIYFLEKKGDWYAYPSTVDELDKTTQKKSVFRW